MLEAQKVVLELCPKGKKLKAFDIVQCSGLDPYEIIFILNALKAQGRASIFIGTYPQINSSVGSSDIWWILL